MKQGLSEIICIIDQSGSMGPVCKDSIGGFNQFIKEQAALPGEAKVTLTLFSTDSDVRCNGVGITAIEPLTEASYKPHGNTALYDAIGKTIDNVGERLDKTREDDRPEKVIVVILTDGEENASRRYTREEILKKINHQRDVYKWEFIFLAANQDAFAAGASIGVHDTVGFEHTSRGTKGAYRNMYAKVCSYRA
jgi:uncharacterized protein YegL